jgi:SAM-dependent methyltransferase
MYAQSAQAYDLLSQNRDYAANVAQLRSMFLRLHPAAATLLDVGCGTARHLSLLARHYEAEGLDASKGMLQVAATRVDPHRLHVGDMTHFDLGRRFDIVTCLFGSLGYAHEFSSLQKAIGCMAVHVSAGGLLVIEPWLTPERFIEGKLVYDSGADERLKVARMYVPRRIGNLSVYDIEYLIGTPEGVRHFSEHHSLGLYTEDEVRSAIRVAGLELLDEASGGFPYGLHVARKPHTLTA